MSVIIGDAEKGVTELPKAGDILIYDCRPPVPIKNTLVEKFFAGTSPEFPVTLKCVQWNIERGYKLDRIIECLKSHHADIICLQELDIGCARSGGRDCALEIAKALEMRCAFFTEFEELHSKVRKPHVQGGGVHGNAILSRFDFMARLVDHTHHPIDWERDGERIGEPRRGRRAILAAEIQVPGMKRPVLCYSLHLEVFCGIFGRLKQMADVFADSRLSAPDHPWQLIFGDLNTMAHGIARLCTFYCRDSMRLGSIGYSEAAWWHENILSCTDATTNDKIRRHAYLRDDADRLVNPFFVDPFSLTKDTTLQGYHGLFKGKLDWTLLRGWRILAKGMDNHHYKWSDHKLLYVVVRPVEVGDGEDAGKVAYQANHIPMDRSTRTRQLAWDATLVGLVAGAVAFGIFRYIF